MGSLFDDFLTTAMPDASVEHKHAGGGGNNNAATAQPAGAPDSTPMTTTDAHEVALRPEDAAEAKPTAVSSATSTSTGGGGGGDTATAAEAAPEAAAVPKRHHRMLFGDQDQQVQVVRDVPMALLVQLKELVRPRLSEVDRVWLERVSSTKLLTAFVAANLGIRRGSVDVDKITGKLLDSFTLVDEPREAMNRRLDELSDQVRLLRTERAQDRERARAVERGVAVLLAERLVPTNELMDLTARSVTKPSHVNAEKLLRELAGELARADRRAESVRG